MKTKDYDLNIYSDGSSVGIYAYELRYDRETETYQTNSSNYHRLGFEIADPDNANVIAFLLRDYKWQDQDWTDYDTWEDPDDYRKHAPKVIEDFMNQLTEYEAEEIG